MEAGELLDTPRALTPDTDSVLWFSVAGKSGLPIIKADGKYIYHVVKKDDSDYFLTFEYKNELVIGLPEPLAADIDYKAVWNGDRERWYIKVSVADELLNAASIKAISKIMEAGEYVAPVELTPDVDTVLWFSVAGKNGLPILKEAGKYMYEVTRQDDTVYVFTFDYDPEEVLDLPDIIDATVDYNAVWNATLERWFVKVSLDEDLDKDTIARIAKVMAAGEYVAPVELVPNTDTVLWFGVANIEADLAYRAAGRYLFEVERKADESVYVFGFTYNPEEVKGLEHIIEFEPKFDLQLPVVEYTLEKWLQYADPAGGNDVGASRVEGFVVIPDAYGIAELADDVKIFNGGYCAVLDADLKPKYFVDRWGRDWNATDGWVVHGADQNEAWAYGVNHFASYFKPHLGEGDLLLMASQYGKGLPGETGTYRNYLGNLLIYDLGSVTADHRGVKQEDLVNPSDVQFIIKENQIGVKDYPTYLTMRAAKGDVMTKPEDPIREGYQFVGWFTDKALTEEFDFELEVNQNYKLYPKWDLIVYEAKFQLNGGTLKIPIFQTKKEMIDAFLKDLYDFINPEDELSVFMHGVDKTEGYDGTWHSNEEYKTKIYAGPRPTEVDEAYFISSAKYMNKWLPLFDVVDKFVNGVNKDQHFYNDTFVGFLRIKVYVMSTKPWGFVSDAVYNLFPQEYLPLKYSIESAKLVLPVVEKDGCSFGGWYDNPEFTGDAWTEIPAKYHEPLEFHAKWEFLGTEIEPEVDYKAVYNEEHKTWYIKVTVPGLSLDIDTISVITVVKKAGEWLVEPIDLVPDTDTVLWFGVCKDDLDLSYKSDGEYKYIVIKKDETLYNFAFIYDHKLVDDLYDRSCAAAVDALISALPEELTPEDKADVEAARVAYDALTESQKGFIQNLAYLETKEAELAVIIAVHEPTYHLNEGERLHPVFADKTAMIEAFLSDFYDYVKPTESLTDFMHGVGKTSGYDGLWHTDTYVLQLYNNNDRESNPAKNKFINQPEYNSKWLPFFDMMEEFTVTVNSSQSFWGSIKWVGKHRIKQYIMNVKPASYVTEETMNMMPPEYLLIKYSFESDALLLPTVVREGYVFGGWYDNADFTGDAWTEIPAGYYKPLDLYAKWLMTITTVRGADVGNEVITKGIITALVGNNAFIQDDGAGIYLYLGGDASFADKLVIGNLVKVKGTRAVYNNLVQISNLADIEVLATAQELPTSVEFVDEVELADLLALQGSLVSVKGFKIKAIPTIGTGAYSVIITNDIVDITIRVDYSVAPFAELKALFSVLEIGANVDFINIPVSQYKEEVQLMLGSLDQIVIDEAIKMDVVKALLALFDGKQFDMDSSVDLPSELMGVTIEWTTDNEVIDLATGEVGTVTKDAVVNLTAKLTIGEVQDTITVVVTVKFLDPTLLYYTGFEDVTKTSYAAGDITSNDITWNLDDALIGNADNDKKVGTKSVRIKNGVVTMKSSLQQVAKLSFQYARYSKDEGTLLAVEISKDGENWVEIMPATTSPNELTEVVLEIDYESEALVTAGITAESEVRFRFVKTGTKDKRVNLDEIYIYTFS
ncbi:MAG: InlB B-repeat-containing protein [Endomicrobiaceae bacterium]|nr:InlB B-repeat-containing protein [Endomicrobiaceae bacterium]